MRSILHMMKWLFILPVVFLTLSFALSNRQEVALQIWPFPVEIIAPAWALVLVFFVIGFLCAAFLSAWRHVALNHQVARQSRRISELQEEIKLQTASIDQAQVKRYVTNRENNPQTVARDDTGRGGDVTLILPDSPTVPSQK